MSTVCAYFLFNGNCLEAMRFYKDCLGGELRIQSLGDHPTTVFPDTMNKLVLQAVLSGEHFRIYGSDLNGSHQIKQGTAMNLFLDLSSEEELFRTYEKLTQKGTPLQAPGRNDWGNLVAEVRDRYGYQWMLHFSQPKTHTHESN